MNRSLLRLISLVLSVLTFAGGVFVLGFAMRQIERMRYLDRLPMSAPGLIMPGVVAVKGVVTKDDSLLTSPVSRTECVYFYRTVEEKDTTPGSSGSWNPNRRLTTEEHVPFKLVGENGFALIDLGVGEPSITAKLRDELLRVERRFYEHRIDPGDEIFVLGVASTRDDGTVVIGFDYDGPYPMVVTLEGAQGLRARVGLGSTALLSLGLVLLTLGVIFFFGALRFPGTISFVLLVGVVSVGTLVWLGMGMLTSDIHSARDDAIETTVTAANEWVRYLEKEPVEELEAAIEVLSMSLPGDLRSEERERLLRHRVDAARRVRRTNDQLASFPENVVAVIARIDSLLELSLSAEEEAELERLDAESSNLKLESIWWWFLAISAAGLGLMLTLAGMRSARAAALLELLPATPLPLLKPGVRKIVGKGVAVGGEIRKGPQSDQPCLWYSYETDEKADRRRRFRIGKEDYWAPPFAVEDEDGVRVVVRSPEKAEVFEQFRSRREGGYTYEERRIEPGAAVTVVGRAEADPLASERMCMTFSKSCPLLISAMPEADALYRKGRSAHWRFGFGLNAFVLFGLIVLGIQIGSSPTQFNLAAIVSIGWTIGTMISLRSSMAP